MHEIKLQKALLLIHKDNGKIHSVKKLAALCGYSPRHFSRIFKETFNQSCKQYQLEIRLKETRDLLLETQLTINEICLKLGFLEQSYLSHCFKQKFGCSPTEYRKRMMNEKTKPAA